MGLEHGQMPQNRRLLKGSAAALAVAALLGQTPASADSPIIRNLLDNAKQHVSQPQASSSPLPPSLILQPAKSPIALKGGGRGHASHSSHSSHSSHASHYSSTVGSGGGSYRSPSPSDPAPTNPPPPPKPSQPATPTRGTPSRSPEQPEETKYPFIVYLQDGRRIECDVQTDDDHLVLAKRAGKIRVLKTDVLRIEKNPLYHAPASQPTTRPANGKEA